MTNPIKKIVGLDPSMTAIGYCVMVNGVLFDAGLIKPPKDLSRTQKLANMGHCLIRDILNEELPDYILIETPSYHVGARHKAGGQGLAIYGFAAGVIWQTCVEWAAKQDKVKVVEIEVDEWTKNRGTKIDRLDNIAMKYPAYAAKRDKDKGGDMGDAIGICDYWLAKQRIGQTALSRMTSKR